MIVCTARIDLIVFNFYGTQGVVTENILSLERTVSQTQNKRGRKNATVAKKQLTRVV